MIELTLWSLATLLMLWVFFLAVMHLRDARDEGLLTGPVVAPAYFVTAIGYLLDVLVQVTLACLAFWELPPKRPTFPWFEPTVSNRLERWSQKDRSLRQRFAAALRKQALSRFDKRGGHGVYKH